MERKRSAGSEQTPAKVPNAVLGPMRVPFLLLTPVCVLLGAGAAVFAGFDISWAHLVLVLVGGTAAHVAVNALNEYHDFRSGLDFKTQKTPFSGGSGALPAAPEKGKNGLYVGLAGLLVTLAVGLYFLYLRGWTLLPIGALGVLMIVAYTPVLTKHPFLCLLAPGLGFGPAMVLGTHVALTGAYSWPAVAASAVPFFLVSDLLLLNQFPDVEPDQTVGRRHLPILWGRKAAAWLYASFLAGAYLSVLIGFVAGVLPAYALFALTTALLGVVTVRGVVRYADKLDRLVPYMGLNVVLNLTTPLLLATGLYFG
jgi:1,4-dihydroxy-2-naphthoate octaprenyltransferase